MSENDFFYFNYSITYDVNEVKLPYGLKNGGLYLLMKLKGGLTCDCVFSVCEKIKVSRKGKYKVHDYKLNEPYFMFVREELMFT